MEVLIGNIPLFKPLKRNIVLIVITPLICVVTMVFKVFYKSILRCSVHRVTAIAYFKLFSPSAALLPFRYTSIIGSLSTRVFETRTATGRKFFACQDSGVSQSFVLIISNGEKIHSNVNVVVWKQVTRENNSLPVAFGVPNRRVSWARPRGGGVGGPPANFG